MHKLLIAIAATAFIVGAGPSAAKAPTSLAGMSPAGYVKFDAKAKKGKSKAGKKSRSAAKK